MRTTEIIKKEIEEEVTKEVICDNCKEIIEMFDSCGFGQAFKLSDAWCYGCGGESWDFCSLKCLRSFVNKNDLDEPIKLQEKK
jgi:hypothetical protein